MAKAARKKTPAVAPMIEFSRTRDIPFNRIRLSDSNVREIDVEQGLDELTQDIDRREDLVMGLNVRAVLDDAGAETGDFETPAGGRRYRAIARLVAAGRFPADGLVPCLVKKVNAKTSAVDDSYAENVIRLALHPLDQFKAFKRMVDGGMSKEEVADAYRTTPRYIAQRLRLARVAQSLLDAYARSEMTLAMLEAFTVNPDHARQEQVWEAIQRSHNRQPWYIRDLLTETTVPTDDKRAQFVGVEAYEQAGGVMLRDLFSDEDEGWLENPALLDRLVSDKLKGIADEVAAEGWKWIEVDTDLPYGHDRGLRVLTGTFPDLSDEERATREALREEYERLEAEHADYDELPDEIDARLGEIEAALSTFENHPAIYDAAEIARAGVFISIDRAGELVVARGYVRPEDEAPVTVDGEEDAGDGESDAEGGALAAQASVQRAVITIGGEPVDAEEDEDDSIKPLPERLVIELTAHRTLALHGALANNPHVAMTALLHRMVMERYHYSAPTGCLEIFVRQHRFGVQGADLSDTLSAKAIDERFDAWKRGRTPVIASAARELLNKSDNERSGVLSTAMSFLGLYRDPVVAEVTRRCDWRIADMVGEKLPTTLYLVVPPSDINRTKPLIRLILNQIGRRLTEDLQAKGDRHRLLLMLDEFPALGRLDFFESALAFMAGYGLKAFLIAQSLNQIEKAYGPNNSILDNCHVRVSFATNDERTAKRVSDALGTATEMKAMKNYAGHRLSPWLGHLMVSRSETARQLLTPGEIMQLPPSDEIVMVAGIPPIRAKKARYYEDARFRERLLSPPELKRPDKPRPDDWSSLPTPARPETLHAQPADLSDDEDTTDSERRLQPELSRAEPVEKKEPIANEFEIELPDDTDEDAARNRRMIRQVQGIARQVALDPNDGMDL